MIKTFGFISLFCFFSFLGYTQLNWVNPKPTGYPCNKIIFTDLNNGFILNTAGYLIKTNDQGNTWTIANKFANMICLDFLDSTGIIAGYSGIIFLSSDKGFTWQKNITGINADFKFVDIVSRDTIFLASSTSLYKSYDRGQTWQTVSVPSTSITCFDFINSQIGFVGKGSQSILKTSDGGQTWQQTAVVNTIPSGITSIKFLNADTGFAYREFSTFLKTTNSGQTWTQTQTNIVDDIYAMSFPTDSIGYIAGQYGAMYRTSDAGNTWTWVSPLAGRIDQYDINSLYFINATIGFGVGKRGRIIKTINGGATWLPYSLIYNDLSDIAFPRASTGYAVSGTNLYKTSDSAKTWNTLSLSAGNNSNSSFEKAYFFSKDTGFVTTGEYVFVKKTNDGGQTWSSVNPTGYYGYEHTGGLSFINDSVGFISLNTGGYGYLLAKTKNRGTSWKGIDSSHFSGEVYYKIHFLDEKTGYALRYSQLYKTSDSAKTWTLVFDNNSTQLETLWFLDQKNGFISDDNGLKRTIDSGHTWTTLSFPYSDREVIALKFFDKKTGYACCSSGNIYQSVDSGATWSLFANEPYPLTNITFSKDSFLYFGGGYGSILSVKIGINFSGKVYLQGAYNTANDSMTNTLNTLGILQANASTQPYNSIYGYGGTENVSSTFFASHPDIVDWVLVELRDPTTPSTVVATRAVFVKQDGTLVDTSATNNQRKFSNVAASNYFVSIRHRNHLGIRSTGTIDFSTGAGSYDFSTSASQSFQNQSYTSTVQTGNRWSMRAGNANFNNNVKYNGPGNDQNQILNIKLGGSLSNILNNVYSPEDINMNGNVKWNGPGNDQNYLLNILLGGSLSIVYLEQLF